MQPHEKAKSLPAEAQLAMDIAGAAASGTETARSDDSGAPTHLFDLNFLQRGDGSMLVVSVISINTVDGRNSAPPNLPYTPISAVFGFPSSARFPHNFLHPP